MAAQVQLVLADDWELRGNGAGNMRAIQFDTMRRLCDVYDEFGIKGSFNVEVMQQLTHRRLAGRHPELGKLADEWEEAVRDAFRRGHDIQLHLHPQWTDAHYDDGHWDLRGAWSILDYPVEQAREMLVTGRDYLTSLLRPLDPDYACISFRSGSWCIAPGPVLDALADVGIVFDMSIVDGLYYETRHVSLDYRSIDETFLPYYPVMDDARRVADSPQRMVCLPTHSFSPSVPALKLGSVARRLKPLGVPGAKRMAARYLAPNETPIPGAAYNGSYGQENWSNTNDTVTSELLISDLSALSYAQVRRMLADIRSRADASGWAEVPVILENHTKDIGDFAPIRRFAHAVSEQPNFHVITLTELARRIMSRVYPVRVAS